MKRYIYKERVFVASKQADEQKKLVIEQEVQKRQFQKIEELKADMQKGVNPFFKVLFDGGNRLFGFPETFIYFLYLYCL